VEAVGALIVVAGVVTAFAMGLARARRVGRVWAEAARELGLNQIEDRGILEPALTAVTGDGLRVSARVQRRRHGAKARFVVQAPALLPETLELRRESLATAFEKRFDHPDVETGDPDFDRAVFVRGHPSLVVALLDREARSDVLRLVRAGGSVAAGETVLETRRLLETRAAFVDEVGRLVDLTRRLSAPRDPAALLSANARKDPEPGVRLRNLELLLGRFPDRPETFDAARSALVDRDPGMRLAGARHLGQEGHAVLGALAADPGTPEAVAAEAVTALGPVLGTGPTADLMHRSLRWKRPAVVLAAVEALGRCGGPEAAEQLTPLVADADEEVAAAAIRGLVVTGDARVPSVLLTAVEHRSRTVRLAACTALGQVGGVEAVPALRAAVAAHPTDLGLRSAVADAVAAIQERAAGAAPGQLALAEGQAGELALVGIGAAGEVALSEAPTEPHDAEPVEEE